MENKKSIVKLNEAEIEYLDNGEFYKAFCLFKDRLNLNTNEAFKIIEIYKLKNEIESCRSSIYLMKVGLEQAELKLEKLELKLYKLDTKSFWEKIISKIEKQKTKNQNSKIKK